MGISFCSDKEGRNVVFEIDDSLFQKLQGVFENFEAKSGVFIDPYGDSRIYYDHIVLLRSCLLEGRLPKNGEKFLDFLKSAEEDNYEMLYLIGD